MSDNPATPEDVIQLWLSYLKTECSPHERYAHQERPRHLDYIIRMLKAIGLDMYDVKAFKTKITDCLITDEGKKGKGKHKDWYRHLKEDFDSMLASYYVEVDTSNVDTVNHDVAQKVVTNNKANQFRQDDDERIVNWLKIKYSNITQLMIDEAHTAGSELNIEYIVDICA